MYGGTAETPKDQPALVSIKQWITIVSRLHKSISLELMALEKSQANMVLNDDFKLNPEQARHLIAVTRAVERVRIINQGVAGDAAGKRTQKALRDTGRAIEELADKIDRFVSGEKA
jgi:hypothetical protein